MSAADIATQFPKLDPVNLLITSPKTPSYNCIAWAAGDQRRWWWPDAFGDFYWPAGVVRAEILAAFQIAFEQLGYRIGEGMGPAAQIERVAIFCKGAVPSHAARQLASGTWSSKFGNGEDASHALHDIEGGLYGDVSLLMHRFRV